VNCPNYEKQKKWKPEFDEYIENLTSIFRSSLIAESELCCEVQNCDTISSDHIMFGMIKSIDYISCTNKLALLERFGPEYSNTLIRTMESESLMIVIEHFKKASDILNSLNNQPNDEDDKLDTHFP
jgi:hypothetical protein